MAMIKGIDIIIPKKIQTGKDEFGRPIYIYDVENGEKVENVLIAPTLTDDIPSSIDLTGKKVTYTLAIPKGDLHNWEDCVVYFWNCMWKSFGYPIEGIEENIPLDWNKKVMVERYG